MKIIFVTLIGLYQRLMRLLGVRSQCRFWPSCSEYAIEAIEKYGVVKGGLLALARISRCRPGRVGGVDPVK